MDSTANLRLAGRVLDSGQRWDCVLWGGYGVGNTGDDLTLAVALKDVQSRGQDRVALMTPHAETVGGFVASERIVPYIKPSGIFRRLGNLALAGQLPRLGTTCYRRACVKRIRTAAGANWIDVLLSTQHLHLVGGGYLTDHFDVEYYLPPVRLAAALGVQVTTSPIGIGPFARASNARRVAAALRTARIKVRDADSLDYCRQYGLNAEERSDDGFRLREVVDVAAKPRDAEARIRRLGVCVFDQHEDSRSSQFDEWWEACLRSIAIALPGWQIQGFCFHTHRDSDFETTRRLFRRAGLDPKAVRPPEPDFRKAVASLLEFDAVLSTRFHAVVAASVLDIPCVAVATNEHYATKMKCAAHHSKSPVVILDPSRVEAATVASQIRWCIEQR